MALAFASPARGQSPSGDPTNYEIISLRDTGDKGAMNLVFLADGFAAAEKDAFLDWARKVDRDFCQPSVLGSHKGLINVFALWVPSVDSGIDEPENGVVKDTFYDTGWSSTSWFFRANRRDFFARVIPWADFKVYILNTPRLGGGSAGDWLFLTPYWNGSEHLISGLFTHEFGHSLPAFADEYLFPGASKPAQPAPNLALNPALPDLPWRHWVSHQTQLPSRYGYFDAPPPQAEWGNAGAFAGCITLDCYRPYNRSFMRQFNWDWAETIYDAYREQFILSLYKYADPIITASPTPGPTPVGTDGTVSFEITVRPVETNLILWYVDDRAVAQGQTRLVLDTAALEPGSHRVTAWVIDGTSAVRMDKRKGLESSRSWTTNTTASRTLPPEKLVQNATTGYPRKALRNGQLIALSTRGFIQGEDQRMIGGFAVTGTQPKRLLIRGAGPALARYGLSEALSDPKLMLFRGGETEPFLVADDWGNETNAAQLPADAAEAGTFSFDPNSKDAALSVALPPGVYTVHLLSRPGVSGVALLEIYDLAPSTSRLVSLSTRGYIASGERSLICGFALRGPETKKCLVRGVGPTLRGYGVGNAVGGVKIDLVNMVGSGFSIMQNQGWGTHPTPWITEFLAKQVGLSGLLPNSQDSVLLADLQPGTYTAVATPDQGVGEALVEIYEIE